MGKIGLYLVCVWGVLDVCSNLPIHNQRPVCGQYIYQNADHVSNADWWWLWPTCKKNIPSISILMVKIQANYDCDDISHVSACDGVSSGQYEGDDKNKTPNTAVNPDLRIMIIMIMISMPKRPTSVKHQSHDHENNAYQYKRIIVIIFQE